MSRVSSSRRRGHFFSSVVFSSSSPSCFFSCFVRHSLVAPRQRRRRSEEEELSLAVSLCIHLVQSVESGRRADAALESPAGSSPGGARATLVAAALTSGSSRAEPAISRESCARVPPPPPLFLCSTFLSGSRVSFTLSHSRERELAGRPRSLFLACRADPTRS